MSLHTGTPIPYWEGLTLGRLESWIRTWNAYAEKNKT